MAKYKACGFNSLTWRDYCKRRSYAFNLTPNLPANRTLASNAHRGQVDIMRWLLDRGADANAQRHSPGRFTPLHEAATERHL